MLSSERIVTGNPRKLRLLYLQTSPVPPPKVAGVDRFLLLSRHLEGEVLQPIWFASPEEVMEAVGPDSWPAFARGSFRYHWYLAWRFEGLKRRVLGLWFYVAEGLRLHREKPIDCVMTYSHMTTALCGVILKWLTGASLVVEVISSPDRVFIHEHPKRRFRDQIRKWYSDLCLHLTLWACDSVHLLYSWQLDKYPLLKRVPRAVFHEFVPVSVLSHHEKEEPPVVLLVGAPWYLKGADLLIKAFQRLSPDFPEVRLRIIGHFPDRDQLEAIAGGSQKIEILKAVPNAQVLQMIASASVLVLASRCEGMGRVLLEAMAAGVPVVGANVGGIPTLVKDGVNGYLFPEEDDAALERCLRTLLADAELRQRMGEKGFELAHGEFSEQVYIERFVSMIETATGARAPR